MFIVSGISDVQGCGSRFLSGGVGMFGPSSEGLVQRCDAGELQQPAVNG